MIISLLGNMELFHPGSGVSGTVLGIHRTSRRGYREPYLRIPIHGPVHRTSTCPACPAAQPPRPTSAWGWYFHDVPWETAPDASPPHPWASLGARASPGVDVTRMTWRKKSKKQTNWNMKNWGWAAQEPETRLEQEISQLRLKGMNERNEMNVCKYAKSRIRRSGAPLVIVPTLSIFQYWVHLFAS